MVVIAFATCIALALAVPLIAPRGTCSGKLNVTISITVERGKYNQTLELPCSYSIETIFSEATSKLEAAVSLKLAAFFAMRQLGFFINNEKVDRTESSPLADRCKANAPCTFSLVIQLRNSTIFKELKPENEATLVRISDTAKKIRENVRDIVVNNTKRIAAFTSRLEKDQSDALDFEVHGDRTPEIRFMKRAADGQFRFNFAKIFVFVPVDPNVGWQGKQVETIVDEISLNPDDNMTKADDVNCTTDGYNITTCVVTFRMVVDNTIIFQVSSQISPRPFDKDGVTHDSRAIKLSIVINYPQAPSSAMIALKLHHRMPRKANGAFEGNALKFPGFARFAFEPTFTDSFGSSSNVIAQKTFEGDKNDNETFDGTNTTSDLRDGRFVFTFASAGSTSVYWDPSVGDGTDSSASASFWTTGAIIGVAAGAAVFFVIIAAFIIKRSMTKPQK